MESCYTKMAEKANIEKNGMPFIEQDSNGRVLLNDTIYFEYLMGAGFHTVRDDNSISFVRIQNNLIRKVIPHDVKAYLVEESRSFGNEKITNYLLRDTKIYKPEYLYALDEIKPDVIRDTKNEAYFFFQNGVVTVTAQQIFGPVPYEQFDKLVWEHKILNRNYNRPNENEPITVFADFVLKLSGDIHERVSYLWSIIGYALHNYRTSANSRAIIFNDEELSSQPEGGSGKTLLVKALGKLRTLTEKDGKTFNPRSTFQWSDVDETTDLVLIDETGSSFSFEDLFSLITSGITIERKFSDKFRLNIEQSPLFLITTNKVVQGSSGSFVRRQYPVDIFQYFSYRHTPIDEYGQLFFEDWSESEWNKFDNFMMECVRYYFNYGVVSYSELESPHKIAVRAVGQVFVDWFIDNLDDLIGENGTTEVWSRYLEETCQSNRGISLIAFVKKIKVCSEIMGYRFSELRTSKRRGFRIDSISWSQN